MAIDFTQEPNGLIVIRASGVLARAEADAAKKQVIDVIHRLGKVDILIIIEPGFSNIDAFASWEDDADDEHIQKHVNRLAIVGDLRWRDSALLFFMKGLLPFSIEFFKSGRESFARAWLVHP